MNVLWIGHYDPEYPRNAALLKGLRANGVTVHEVRVALSRPRRLINLITAWREYRKNAPPPDLIIVPMIDLETAPFALALARRYGIPLVYDAFECRYTTNVIERGLSRRSLKAVSLFQLERWVLKRADLILVDTQAHGRLFQETYHLPGEKFHVFYISLDDDLFQPATPLPSDGFLVQFVGYFHPLTGSETILRAAALLRDHPDIRFEVVGWRENEASQKIRELISSLQLTNFTLKKTVPHAELSQEIQRAAVCLGVFGDTDQAARVVPNKGYLALAMAKPLITRDSPALREILQPGIEVEAVAPADPQALADAILRLKQEPARRESIARQGYEKFKSELTPAVLGQALVKRLEQLASESARPNGMAKLR